MRSRIAPAVIAFSIVQMSATAAPAPGQVELAAFRGVDGVAGLEVSVDGRAVGVTDAAGRLSFAAGPGLHLLVLSGPSGRVASTEFRLGDADAGEIAVALPQQAQGEARVDVDVFNTRSVVLVDVGGAVRTASGAPAAGATVTALGTGISTLTDAQGSFSFKLPRGSYTLEVKQGVTAKQFTGVSASPLLATSALALQLDAAPAVAGATTELNKVVVRAPFRRGSTVSTERAAVGVVDRVSQEEISIAGDSDAGEALKRVTGVTVQDDIIVVRGLGDRYSTTLLNGAEIPSPNPSRRVISLDIFPTDLLGGLTVQKTYTANLPGDFSGGVALIESRPIPNVNKGSLEVKVGGNSETTGARTLTYKGSNGDDFGVDGGIRQVPTSVIALTQNNALRLQSLTEAERLQVVSALPNIWDLRLVEDTEPDVGLAAGYGGVLKSYYDIKIGYQLSGFYDNEARFRREERNDLRSAGDSISVVDRARLQRTDRNVDTGLVGGLSVELNADNKIDLVTLLSNNSQKTALFTEAEFVGNFEGDARRTTLDFIESSLFANQLTGRHGFESAGDLQVKWLAGYSEAQRDVLDRRSYEFTRNSGAGGCNGPAPDPNICNYRLAFSSGDGGNAPQRDYEFLEDDTLDLGVDFNLPVEFTEAVRTELKAGVRSTSRSREFDTVRYGYFNPGAQQNQIFSAARLLPSLEQILVPELFGSNGGFDIQNVNSQTPSGGGNSENYTGDQDIEAFYVAADTSFGESYKADLGVRVEKSELKVITGDPRQGGTTTALLEDTDVLPAVNLTWVRNRQQQVRAAYSMTVNRPQFRELAEVQFLDPESRFISFGNPNLRQAEIDNFDLRFEQYWSSDKAVSVALFYKDFKNPIEVALISDSTQNPVRTFRNSPSAKDYGIEFDGRYKLDRFEGLWAQFSRMYIAGNLALIESEVKTEGGGTRELQGQSPYIVNFTLGYSIPGKTDIALLFNTFGDRISEVGFDGLPNAKEQSYPLLDFNIRHAFTPEWRLAVKLRNLLDPDIEVRQGDVVQRRYQLGISGQASLEYQF